MVEVVEVVKVLLSWTFWPSAIVIGLTIVSGLAKHIIKTSTSWIQENGRSVNGWERFVSLSYLRIRKVYWTLRPTAAIAVVLLALNFMPLT